MSRRNMHRLVHLDLKGGAPKISYLLSLLPHFKRWGATGILIEYENTFPYYGELAELAAPWAYTNDDIAEFQHVCQQLCLEIIPLIQTFGHAEFILHHERFRHLREHPNYPNCFCPSHHDSILLIDALVIQMLNAHPNITNIHIGCDEVSPLGTCARCTEKMEKMSIDKSRLYVEHVALVARTVKQRRPLNVIIWDDMIRKFTPETIHFDLCSLVEPMVWYYGMDSIPDVFDVYSTLFPRIWCASAFKGASGCTETLPNIALHISNTKLWFAVMHDLASRSIQIAGIALTGWSRYDYFGVLCELLPAGIPSLVACMRIFASESGWSEAVHLEASRLLEIDYCMPVEWQPRPKPIVVDLRFPGDQVFIGSQCQANLLRRFVQFVNGELYRGWMHNYNVRRKYVHVGTVRQLGQEAHELQKEFVQLKAMMTPSMREIFPSHVVDEWFGEHVDVYVEKLEKTIRKSAGIIDL